MGTNGGWLKGCGIGCGVTVLILIVVFIGCGYSVMSPFRSAQQTREQLDGIYGAQADYRPAPDGAVTPERLDAFLQVRERLLELCAGFDEAAAAFEGLDAMDEDASKTDAMRAVFGAMDEIMGMPALMGHFEDVRNEALLEAEMGLGEYSYIYVLTYFSWLGMDLEQEGSPLDGSFTSRRQREILRDMLRAQLEDLREADPDDTFASKLAEEILRLEADTESIPWREGPPPAMAAVLEPYRERLVELWCANTASGELSISKTRGLSVHAD